MAVPPFSITENINGNATTLPTIKTAYFSLSVPLTRIVGCHVPIILSFDNLYSNYICHVAWFGSEESSQEKIIQYIQQYNNMDIDENNYMTDNFANTYFSRSDCSKIGFIREDIEKEYAARKINDRERALLITSLLYAMDKIANTCGHYDAYRKGVEFEKHLALCRACSRKVQQSK